MTRRALLVVGVLWLAALLPGPRAATPLHAQQPPSTAPPVLGALHIIPHPTTLIGAAWAARDDTVLSWAADGRLRFFAAESGALLQERTLAFAPQGLVLSPDTARLAIWNAAQLVVQNTTGPGTVQQFEAPSPVNGARWANSGRRLWTWHPDGTLIGWDVGPAQQPTLAVRVEHSTPIDRVRFNDDESAAILESWGGVGALVDFETQVVTPFGQQTGALVGGLWVGEQLFSWGWDGSLWPQPAGRINERTQTSARFWDALVVGEDILTPTADFRVLLWDTATLQPRVSLRHDDRITSVSSAAGLVLTTAQDNTARLWKLADGTAQLDYTHGVAVRAGGLSADGTRLWTIADDNTLRLFVVPGPTDCYVTAPANANQRAEPSASGAFVETLAAYTSGLVNAVTTGDAGFRWWQLENGAWVREDVVLALPACDALPYR